MKLLILGINFSPEMIGTAVYTTGLADAMADAGDRVEVVTAQPYYPAWKVSEGHPRFGWTRRRRPSGVSVVHCPHYVPARPSGARRILHHASFALSALPVMAWKMLRFRPDVVMVVAPALLPAPMAVALARLGGARTWLHVQDFEVEAAFATGLLRPESRIGRLAQRFDRWIHRRFDRVSSISAPMLAKLRERVPAERIHELRNWANLSVVRPMPEGTSPYRAEFGITTPHVALYSGNVANKQGLELIPEVARRLRHRQDLTFVICGEGSFLPDLKAAAEGLDNIRFFPLQPMERLGDLLALGTVHLLPQIAGVAELVLPSKLTNMLASGRPVVATAGEETALGQAVAGCGTVTPPGDAGLMAASIGHLLDDDARRAELGANALERALDQWDATRILARFRRAALGLIDVRRAASNHEPETERGLVE